MAKNFSKLMINYKPNSKNTKQDKYQKMKHYTWGYYIQTALKERQKRKSWRRNQPKKKKTRKIKTIQKNHNFKMLQTKMCIILKSADV